MKKIIFSISIIVITIITPISCRQEVGDEQYPITKITLNEKKKYYSGKDAGRSAPRDSIINRPSKLERQSAENNSDTVDPEKVKPPQH